MTKEYEVTYQMSDKMFKALAATQKGKKQSPQDYVKDIVQDTFGLRGTCINVVIKG